MQFIDWPLQARQDARNSMKTKTKTKKKAQRIVNDKQSNQGFFFCCCFNKHSQITHAQIHTQVDMILS